MKNKILKTLFVGLTLLSLVYAADERCEVTITDGHRTETCPDLYYCKEGMCVHKDIFPMSKKEIIGTVLIMIVTGLANAGGSSGTALTTLLLLIFFNYNENKGVMIAYALVFGGALGNFINVGFGKNKETGKPQIDYNICLICMPLMLLGTSFGILANRMIAPFFIAAGLAYVMYISLGKIFKKAKKEYEEESNKAKGMQKEIDQGQEMDVSPTKKDIIDFARIDPNNDPEGEVSEEYKAIAAQEQERFPKKKLTLLGSLLLVSMVAAYVRGTKKFDSIFGVEYCSNTYWGFYFAGVVICLGFFFYNYEVVWKIIRVKQALKLDQEEGAFQITDGAVKTLARSSVVAGIVAGLLGMGGSTVMGPVLLGLGVDVQTVVATSGFFVLQTSFMALFQSALYGDISMGEMLFFLVTAFVGSYGISCVISTLVKLTQRPSIVLFILVFIFSLALIAMPIFEVWRSVHNLKELFTFSSICS